MTFAELVVAVHDWMRRLSPGQVRNAIKHQLESEEGVEGFHRGISVDAALVIIRMGLGPGCAQLPFATSVGRRRPRWCPSRRHRRAKRRKQKPRRGTRFGTGPGLRGRLSKRAQALVLEQLANGPKPGVEIEAAAKAAEIPVIVAADERSQHGQWWLQGKLNGAAPAVGSVVGSRPIGE